MTDESSTPGTDEQDTTEDNGQEQAPKPTETVDFWKSKAREQEKRAKDNAAKAKRFDELEEAKKTDAERAEAALREANDRAEKAESALLRYEVAAAKAVPPNAVQFLTGSTREEMEASAEQILELIGDAGKPRSPRPDPNQGRGSNKPNSTGDMFASVIGDLF